MAQNIMKSTGFDKGLVHRAKLYKALSHPARLAILSYLAEIKTCITGDIAEEIPLSRTTVNQHLRELRNAGLIRGTVEGVRTNYCLNPDAIDALRKESDQFLKLLDVKTIFC
jgi:ArsR family transcriptional regulator, arsenate/arsenite/antimonite-responsive transcriptional repressor